MNYPSHPFTVQQVLQVGYYVNPSIAVWILWIVTSVHVVFLAENVRVIDDRGCCDCGADDISYICKWSAMQKQGKTAWQDGHRYR